MERNNSKLDYILKFDVIIAALIIASAILFGTYKISMSIRITNHNIQPTINVQSNELDNYIRELKELEKDKSFYDELKNKKFFENSNSN